MNYIYIIHLREYFNTNQNIYKIGKTKQELFKRFKQYPKGSQLISQYDCSDCDIVEKNIINLFKNKYIQRKDIGTEYFEGDILQMKDDIYNETKNNIELSIKLNNNITEWTLDDIILGGKNQYIKIIIEDDYYFILFLTNDCIKNNKIIKYNKHKINSYISIKLLIKQNKIKLNEFYNINDKNFIDILNSVKRKLSADNMHLVIRNFMIDSSINYTDVITYTNNINEKILIIFGNTILNDKYVISFNDINNDGNIRTYNFTCKLLIPNLNFIDDITITIVSFKYSPLLAVGKLFKNNKEIIEMSENKPYFKYIKIPKLKPINYDVRYKKIINNLKKITNKNIQSSYFTSYLYNKYIVVGLHNFINDYYNNVYGYRDTYKNVGLYMNELHSTPIRNVCMNDEQYNIIL